MTVEDQRIQYVSVQNGLDHDLSDMWDGVPIRIPAGKKDNLRIEVANHIFGYHPGVTAEAMLRHFAKRQGWNTKEWMEVVEGTSKTRAQIEFAKFIIKPVTFRMVPADEDAARDEAIPADPEARPSPRRIEVRP